ncbi:DUF4174 domain-containing protein [Roseivivax isoporae]|uniref:DUF4174 domain-containing protein n=1 Tax=Roseivivax isoporae LMG 25204 TaxID=1449351 RepID=X7F872_9RHOB|nr:DUF4174 domain-containing protein [Roseivivax isoporae]ETX28301.1 hypothetical protein RISW2_08370 [Roseivivax isoporae LMG 25204]
MRRVATLVTALTLAGVPLAADTFRDLPAGLAGLDAHRWQHRPVVLFAPSPDDPAYRAQMAALRSGGAGLAERDIVVLSDTAPDADGTLRARFAPEGFLAVLVGKDGGVKLRSEEPLALRTLFDTIDAMPMRRQEMRAP